MFPAAAAAILLPALTASAGPVNITKCAMIDKTHSTEVLTGYADADLSVDFVSAATHTCECGGGPGTLRAIWTFGDGSPKVIGWNVSHTYGTAGGGDPVPILTVHCTACDKFSGTPLRLRVISDVEIDRIGDIENPDGAHPGRMCFNNEEHFRGRELPIQGSIPAFPVIMDWRVYFSETGITLLAHDSADGSLPMLDYGQWPSSNSQWGYDPNGIAAFADAYDQEGEMNLTGPASEVAAFAVVYKYYETDGDQNPAPGDEANFYYYYSQTSANYGVHTWRANHDYDNTPNRGYNTWDAPDYTTYIGVLANDAGYLIAPVGQNANETMSFIDDFAWTARHEGRHHEQKVMWWPSGPNPLLDTETPPNPNFANGDGIPDALEPSFTAAEGGPYNPALFDTYTNDDGLQNDIERHAVFTQAPWITGSADTEDWARPGKQWNP